MLGIKDFYVFLAASLLLNITPGTDMLYIITRSTSQGRRAGIVSALGIGSGSLVHMTAAALGLSAIFLYSALAYEILKWFGVAYLLYLGIRTLLKKESTLQVRELREESLWKVYRQGVLVNILNPKVALFFLAFLPQFIDPGTSHATLQILFLGGFFNLGGTIINIGVAILFGYLGVRFIQHIWVARIQKWLTGSVFLGLGLNLALSKRQ
ncbi:MAG TPA: LysE family translocator [Ktedonobacteraceae bacterium]|jgi:threonine/homoserine/homoserine lactone efflux protein|nr:LysE family translocator [Ktedonobacteraceae bacterium]